AAASATRRAPRGGHRRYRSDGSARPAGARQPAGALRDRRSLGRRLLPAPGYGELLPGAPDREDEQVSPDEQDDEALDDERQVPGKLRIEDVGSEVPRARARQQGTEEER